MSANTLMKTNFHFPGQVKTYKGKVREVYYLDNNIVALVATDRLSAFDVVMPRGIPYKGQILNQIALKMLKATSGIVPNWFQHSPDPNVTIGIACEPIKIEMVIRGYLAGHASREYKLGKRTLCGVNLPDGMRENDPFPEPIITPATKAEEGNHDEDISREEIISRGIVSEEDYNLLENYTKKLFEYGTGFAADNGLILVDTKYEFGRGPDGSILLIDEVHTPDSSRYFYAEGYEDRQEKGEPQKQLSKEFVRQWLIANKFQGLPGQEVPSMTDDYIQSVSQRYIELYEKITGEPFVKADASDIHKRIDANVREFLKTSSGVE